MFLDIHSHHVSEKFAETQVLNYIVPEEPDAHTDVVVTDKKWLSIGIHPWYISSKNLDEQLVFVEKMAQKQEVKLIGECGLDRLRGPDFSMQANVFLKQITLAEQVEKPVIIHCVRYFSELFGLIKARKPSVPLIIHGFNKNERLAMQILEKGCYLSFGAALLNPTSNVHQVIQQIPLDRLFLETDDARVDIEQIYRAAAASLSCSISALQAQIDLNFKHIIEKNG